MIFCDPANNRPYEILALGDYHPYWNDRDNRVKNPEFSRNWDGYILAIKKDEMNERDKGVSFFFNKLNPLLHNGFTIAIVPSSNPENVESGICQLAKRLVTQQRIDATSCLVRHTAISKLSHGGDRSIAVHLNSIKVVNSDLIRGKEVLLLDDVTTSGNSLRACQRLLINAGASVVQCYALGKTVRKLPSNEELSLDYDDVPF